MKTRLSMIELSVFRLLGWAVVGALCIIAGSTACNTDDIKELLNSRIKSVETVQMNGIIYQIISVDGKEYIVSSSGGIYPLQ